MSMDWCGTEYEAWIQLSDARLVVLKNVIAIPEWDWPNYGWRWVLIPMTLDGHLDIKHPVQWTDVNSESEPYSTQYEAKSACERYYNRRGAWN